MRLKVERRIRLERKIKVEKESNRTGTELIEYIRGGKRGVKRERFLKR